MNLSFNGWSLSLGRGKWRAPSTRWGEGQAPAEEGSFFWNL
jgi:hypothetical protein